MVNSLFLPYFGFYNSIISDKDRKREMALNMAPQSCLNIKWTYSGDTENTIFFSYGFAYKSKWQLSGQQNSPGIWSLKALGKFLSQSNFNGVLLFVCCSLYRRGNPDIVKIKQITVKMFKSSQHTSISLLTLLSWKCI